MVKILIVEDDKVLIEMYETRLLMEEMDVHKAIDGQEALEKLESIVYDLVLLDIMLPKVDGITILKKVRASNWPVKHKPILVFSNLGQAEDIKMALDEGATEYLIKHMITPNEVVAKIKKYLK